MRLIGLSLSFCISDILRGLVEVDQVEHIQTNCTLDSVFDIIKPETHYMESYWYDFTEDQVREVLTKLDGKLRWRRSQMHNIHPGRWMTEFKSWEPYHGDVIAHGTYWDPTTGGELVYHGDGSRLG